MGRRQPSKSDIRKALAADSTKGAMLFASLAESGSMNISTLNKLESPKNKAEAFLNARDWRKKNWFVGTILELKQQYACCGMQFNSGDPDKEEEFQAWLTGKKKKAKATRESFTVKKPLWMQRYVTSAFGEYLLNDNLISMWFDVEELKSDFPAILPPESCIYQDALGVETLKYDFGIRTSEDKKRLREAGIDNDRVERYAKGFVTLEEEQGEYYLVATRGLAGQGLAWPRIYTIFRSLTQNESMEVGESLLAYMGRLVIRFHKKGFEPKNTTTLKLKDFMWTKEWAESVKKFFTPGKFGAADATGNFDHKIEYVWIDPKNYIGTKWETIINRLVWWAGPLGFMLMAKSQSLNWMTMFQTEIQCIRRDLTPHIEFVLNSFYDAPGGIKVSFSDGCFKDSRLLWDMIKTLMQQGAGSLTTTMKHAGLDPATEGDQNEIERDPKNEKRFGAPVYDAAHMALRGQLDAAKQKGKKGEKGGRKTGSKDGDKV